jgi:excisionase family DNA binding protein
MRRKTTEMDGIGRQPRAAPSGVGQPCELSPIEDEGGRTSNLSKNSRPLPQRDGDVHPDNGSGGSTIRPIDLTYANGKGLVRVEEAAKWLGLGRTKAWELVYAGSLHSVTIGRSRRIPVFALHDFVAQLMAERDV